MQQYMFMQVSYLDSVFIIRVIHEAHICFIPHIIHIFIFLSLVAISETLCPAQFQISYVYISHNLLYKLPLLRLSVQLSLRISLLIEFLCSVQSPLSHVYHMYTSPYLKCICISQISHLIFVNSYHLKWLA